MSTPSLCLRSMTPRELHEGRNPNAMQRGEYGSGIVFFPEDPQCSANLQFIPEKGYTYRFATFPFVLLKELMCLLGLQDLPE